MTIRMPESYVTKCRNLSIVPPSTSYHIAKLDKGVPNSVYQITDTFIPGTPRGKFTVLYALKSFARQHDNRMYTVFFVTKQGVFKDEHIRTEFSEPIDFKTVYARYLFGFNNDDVCINYPGSRALMFLHNVQWSEVVNGVHYPNSYDFRSEPIRTYGHHRIIIWSEDFPPVDIKWNPWVYDALKHGYPYLNLREDNYVPFNQLRFWNPTF